MSWLPNITNELIELPFEWDQSSSPGTKMNCCMTISFDNAISCTLKYVTLRSSHINTIAEFKNAMSEGKLEIQIGGTTDIKSDFSVLMESTEVTKSGNNYTIFIPNNKTYLVALYTRHKVRAIVNIPNAQLIENVSLAVNYKFFNRAINIEIAEEQQEDIEDFLMSNIQARQLN